MATDLNNPQGNNMQNTNNTSGWVVTVIILVVLLLLGLYVLPRLMAQNGMSGTATTTMMNSSNGAMQADGTYRDGSASGMGDMNGQPTMQNDMPAVTGVTTVTSTTTVTGSSSMNR